MRLGRVFRGSYYPLTYGDLSSEIKVIKHGFTSRYLKFIEICVYSLSGAYLPLDSKVVKDVKGVVVNVGGEYVLTAVGSFEELEAVEEVFEDLGRWLYKEGLDAVLKELPCSDSALYDSDGNPFCLECPGGRSSCPDPITYLGLVREVVESKAGRFKVRCVKYFKPEVIEML